MASTADFIEFVLDQIRDIGDVRYRKMFGEYMVYINDKPIILVCEDTVFIKKHDVIADLMASAETNIPYNGAKEHYVLDIEDKDLAKVVLELLEEVTPLPKPRKKKA